MPRGVLRRSASTLPPPGRPGCLRTRSARHRGRACLALTLTDGFTTNIWALSTGNGDWRQVTDFGDRAMFIPRRVAWSPNGKSILAAVGEGDADIVLLDGANRSALVGT